MNILLALLSSIFAFEVAVAANEPVESGSKSAAVADTQYLNFIAPEPLTLGRIDQAHIGAYIPFIPNAPDANIQTRFEFKILQFTAKGVSDAALREITTIGLVAATPDR